MDRARIINIAVVDSCEYVTIGLSALMHDEKDTVYLTNYPNLSALADSETQYDIVLYDPLTANGFLVDIQSDIRNLRERQPTASIYIYSAGAGFLAPDDVDGSINKLISLREVNALWNVIITKSKNAGIHYGLNINISGRDQVPLTDEEISVMRGYSGNLKTKQIANYMGCNVKTVYLHKYAAMRKLNTQCNSRFYSSLRHIIC